MIATPNVRSSGCQGRLGNRLARGCERLSTAKAQALASDEEQAPGGSRSEATAAPASMKSSGEALTARIHADRRSWRWWVAWNRAAAFLPAAGGVAGRKCR